MKVISDVPVSRNWYKTLSNLYENYTKLYLYELSYKIEFLKTETSDKRFKGLDQELKW